jgi:hypothetical protein
MDHRRAAFRLGEHNAVGTAGHHGIEIVVGQAGGEPVDADVEARALRCGARLLEKRRGDRAGLSLARRRNRVLEIEQQRIGAAAHALGEFLRAVAGDEEEGTHASSVRVARSDRSNSRDD